MTRYQTYINQYRAEPSGAEAPPGQRPIVECGPPDVARPDNASRASPLNRDCYSKQNLHPSFTVVSDSEIDVTTTAGAAGLTYEIDFFTPTDDYFTTNYPKIPLFTFQ
jgi:hypothetical protein